MDKDKSCPTANMSNIGCSSGPSYLTSELLKTSQIFQTFIIALICPLEGRRGEQLESPQQYCTTALFLYGSEKRPGIWRTKLVWSTNICTQVFKWCHNNSATDLIIISSTLSLQLFSSQHLQIEDACLHDITLQLRFAVTKNTFHFFSISQEIM